MSRSRFEFLHMSSKKALHMPRTPMDKRNSSYTLSIRFHQSYQCNHFGRHTFLLDRCRVNRLSIEIPMTDIRIRSRYKTSSCRSGSKHIDPSVHINSLNGHPQSYSSEASVQSE
eukprot:755739_1